MGTLTFDPETDRALAELARSQDKTPAEIVRDALRVYQAEKSAYDETAYLLSTPTNARDLLEAIEDIKQRRYQRRELVDDAD